MTYLDKTTNFNGNESTGFTYLFEDDSEITLDMSGQIVDYSGMGSERAEKCLNELSKSTTGVKYSELDEYQQDLIDENIKGLKDLYSEII
jgi:phosphoglucomutase